MSAISQRTMMITGVSALVIAAFALGYLLGSKSTKAPAEAVTSISPSDMRGAFGNKPIAPEGAQGAMGSMGSMAAQGTSGSQAGSLGGLVAGLEKKVAANPENIDQQLLLARTYLELGERGKGLKLLRKLHQGNAKNMDVNMTLATLLMAGTDKQELQEAYQLLEDATQQKPEVAPMARLYQGEIQLKLGDTAKALKIWKSYLAKLPPGNEQRALFEERIAQNSGK